MGTNTNLLSGIFSYLATYESELPEIYWPNVAKDSDLPDEYLIVDILPAQTRSFGVKSGDQLSGIIQILVSTKKDTGAIRTNSIADQILDIFPRNTEIIESGTKIRIDKRGYTSPAMDNEAWYSVAVSIPYNVITG